MDGLVHDQIRDLQALVVGAGFGGISMLLSAEAAAGYPSFSGRRYINRFHHKPTVRCASRMAHLKGDL